ncbi:MAG: SBBP repeat-containing protein [Pyrinomonadaceae bacterium]
MKQTHGYSRYLATFLISTTMMVIGMDTNKTGLHTKVSAKVSKETAVSNMGSLPVYFEENKGQFNEKVRYFTRGTSGYSLFLTATDAVYVLSSKEHKIERKASNIAGPEKPTTEFETAKPSKAVAVYMSLEGANQNSEWSGLQPLEHCTNYFQGSDESEWQTDIPNYQSVRTNQIYEGIDMVWHGKEKGAVQYDFVIQPNANPNQIEWKIQGATGIELSAEGDLLIKTEYGDIRQNKPFTYQETNGLRAEVESYYIVEKGAAGNDGDENSFRIKFDVGSYDSSKPLIIDPTVNLSNLAFSTFLGGSESDWGNAIATDAVGNVYIAGRTGSMSFQTTPGAFDTTHNGTGFTDVFVTKVNATGSALIYSTFIGGFYSDDPNDIAVDSSGNVFLIGETRDAVNNNYPTTTGAYDRTHNGNFDVFVTKLNPTGSALVYSTYLGGSDWDRGGGISVDATGNAYLTGFTYDGATDFPTTVGAFDTTQNGFQDAFVTKLNAEGSALIYSTFIGSSGHEGGWKIAVDSSGNVFLTGGAYQNGFYPTTEGVFDRTHNGEYDVFVTSLKPSGSALIYSTFIGGANWDTGSGIAVDASGYVFVTGETSSNDYPTTPEAFDTTYNGGQYDAFVTKLDARGATLAYSTFIGGSSDDQATDLVIDSSGNAFLTGETLDAVITDYPTTAGAFDTTHNGNSDVFVTKVNSTGSGLLFSSFIGGSSDDGGSAITVDSEGSAFLTGITHGGFPTTVGAFDTTYNNVGDAFVSKFGASAIASAPFDFDGDGKSDLSVYRPSAGNWYLLRSTEGFNITSWGLASDIVAPGDFDGDGKADFSVFRPSEGNWYIANSSGTFTTGQFGLPGDIPVPADYDGDGKDDRAVFRPSNSTWYILNSNGFNVREQAFGLSGDRPVPGDYDGDTKADLAVFRPSNGTWYRANSGNGNFVEQQWGLNGDIPVNADYDGDNKQDYAVFRPSAASWFILNSTNGSYNFRSFGLSGDVPVPGDYDGNGLDDIAVFRNGFWYIIRSAESYSVTQFGLTGDIAIPAK